MHDREHPAPDLLVRFARGESASAENRVVVRHLIGGCPECIAVLWPVWKIYERLALRRAPHPQLARRQKGWRRGRW
jgi:hypothetical protein